MTGNHWVTLACIHPMDASIHLIGVLHAGARAAVEFAGSPEFADGTGNPIARLSLELDGQMHPLGAEGLTWEREVGWVPSFGCRIGDVSVRGTICAPHGRNADVAGAVLTVAIENRGATRNARVVLSGALGHRQLRVQTARPFPDAHRARAINGELVLDGTEAPGYLALAIGSDGVSAVTVDDVDHSYAITMDLSIGAGETVERGFYIAAGPEMDGALATLAVMKRRGWKSLIGATRAALREMEPSTGVTSADRLIARSMFFAFFCAVGRALDDAHVYVVRSRLPWNGRGMTIRDWEALVWVLPAIQLADPGLARELLLRMCELHGYAPGGGVHYLDGSIFEAGFSLEGACAFPIAVDSYIVATNDDRIVEEPVLADALYGAHEDIETRRHTQFPLYGTEVNPDGSVPTYEFTAHGNAFAALAFDILRRTLDEKTAEKVEDSAAVRAALLRHFALDPGGKQSLAASVDLGGASATKDEHAASMYWLPYYDLISREDSIYRRTTKRLDVTETTELVTRCARLVGPASSEALDWLRRAPLGAGLAAEIVDEDGRAVGNAGDAALSGLVAYLSWYAVHALGAKA
ncbi:MAG TPA: hypothetical protein VM939_11640 [Gemmatimonadaceae bacterium]|nr:hypothetical protein [Gemmatimonadaceae bacterium]